MSWRVQGAPGGVIVSGIGVALAAGEGEDAGAAVAMENAESAKSADRKPVRKFMPEDCIR